MAGIVWAAEVVTLGIEREMNRRELIWIIIRFIGIYFGALFLYNVLDLCLLLLDVFHLTRAAIQHGFDNPIVGSGSKKMLAMFSFRAIKYIFYGVAWYYCFKKGTAFFNLVNNSIHHSSEKTI